VGARGTRSWARVRWVDPLTGRPDGVKRSHACLEDAELWVDRMRRAAQTGVDSGQTRRDYFDTVGNRWTRGIDPTSTYDPYMAGLRRRVLPTLGHLPVALISAGLVDRAIDEWQKRYGRSTVKNTVSALVLVLDEAVRDGIIVRNPAKDRARRRTVGRCPVDQEPMSPRDLALPDVATLERLVPLRSGAGRRADREGDPASPARRSATSAKSRFLRGRPRGGPPATRRRSLPVVPLLSPWVSVHVVAEAFPESGSSRSSSSKPRTHLADFQKYR
jgi:hypothetical protein